MRIINNIQLPPDLNDLIVIKSNEKTGYHKMHMALERTLSKCSEIRLENELYVAQLRDKAEKDGFHSGFQLFFSELLTMLDNYENIQSIRMANYRLHLLDAVKEAFLDPIIVERIISYLSEKSIGRNMLTVILPRAVKLSAELSNIKYQFTEEDHITVQNDLESIRFPIQSICSQWLKQADENTDALNSKLNTLGPNLLRGIAEKLMSISENSVSINQG